MPTAPSPVTEVSRVRFRRAVTLLLMTLVLPGSAQLVAGSRRVGRVAVRITLALWVTVGCVVVLGLLWPGAAFWLLSTTTVLGAVRVALLVLAVGWAALFLDAWRLGRPLQLLQKQRLAMVGLNGVLCFSVAGGLLFASHIVAVQRNLISAMFGDGHASDAHEGRYNVLLLGGDSGKGRWGLRPDSITLASIDADTGHTVLFGLPRNMQNFPFREGSPMDEQFPNGFDCEGCYLNSLSTWAAERPELFRKHDHPGVEATIQAVEGITGLSLNYYAMVNLRGFRDIVDAVGGLRLHVRDRIPIGGVGGPVTGYIEPGAQRLNGFETLWFARSREGTDDYSRMARQKCVMNAMLRQLSPRVVVTKFERLAEASAGTLSTDLPASELGRFVELAMKAKEQPLTTVSFVPPEVDTADPDITRIHEQVEEAIARSEAREGGEAPRERRSREGPRRSVSSAATSSGGSVGSLAEGYAANDAKDVSSAC